MRETLGKLLRNLVDRIAGGGPAARSQPGPRSTHPLPSFDLHELFDFLVAGVRDYAIFLLDPGGYVRSWNAGAERIKGYQADEILGQHFARFYESEAILAGKPDSELRAAQATGRFEDEGWRLRKDSSRFWANVVITVLRNNDGNTRGYLKITRDLTERKASEERLRQANTQLEIRVEERTAELVSTNWQLAATNSRLQAEVVERKRAEEALKEADRRKNEFIAMLSHELRNPLACLRNALFLKELQSGNQDDARETQAVMERQVDQLVRLVDDLLDVSRIVQGRIELRKQRVKIGEVLGRAVDTIRPVIDAHGHDLDISLPPEPLLVEGDAVRLVQILINLLENAALYQWGAGRIWLSAKREDDWIVVRVRDSGMGISATLLPHIFETFVQDERPLARSQGGMGIGLTLVRRLAKLHGGTVTAHSEGPGRGSEFVVRVPALVLPPEGEGEPVREHPAQSLIPSRERVPVLVVDDNVDAAMSLAGLLTKLGYEARTVFDGPSALEAARSAHPSVILLDIGLPGMDGYEVAKQLRSEPRFRSVLLAAVTGYGLDEDRKRSREAGFDRHFTKPVDLAAVRDFLAAAVPSA